MARLEVSGREIFSWCLVLILSYALWTRRQPLGEHFHYKKGGNCLCNTEDYCLCTPSLAIDVIVEVPSGSIVLVRRADNGKVIFDTCNLGSPSACNLHVTNPSPPPVRYQWEIVTRRGCCFLLCNHHATPAQSTLPSGDSSRWGKPWRRPWPANCGRRRD